jgi:hypothetical protein
MNTSIKRLAVAVLTVAAAALPLLSTSSAGATDPSGNYVQLLPVGQALTVGHIVSSPDSINILELQTDGNMVIYARGRAIWSTKTSGKKASFAVLQSDGNFVLYTAADKPLWQSHTAKTAGSRVQMQNDGNLVIYSATDKATWASHSNYCSCKG